MTARRSTQPLIDPLLSVVMPAYNERDTIEEIIRRVLAVPLRIELIVVDDASIDGTRDILRGAVIRRCRSDCCSSQKNAGKGAALSDRDLPLSPATLSSFRTLISSTRRKSIPSSSSSSAHGPARTWSTGRDFIGRHRVFLFTHYVGNWILTLRDQHPVQHDPDRHGDLLQGDAGRRAALDDAPARIGFGIEPELTAKIFKRRLPRVRSADHV